MIGRFPLLRRMCCHALLCTFASMNPCQKGIRNRTGPAEPNRTEPINSGTGRNQTRNRTKPNRTEPVPSCLVRQFPPHKTFYTSRRRENMVGVNMAFHCAICECFEGAMLEPCLLQPCIYVAGLPAAWRHADLSGADPPGACPCKIPLRQ